MVFLSINLNMCFGCSKEPSQWDGCFEYPQHIFWMRNNEHNFPIRTLIWRPEIIAWTIFRPMEFSIKPFNIAYVYMADSAYIG